MGLGLGAVEAHMERRDFLSADLVAPTVAHVVQSGLLTQPCFIVLTTSCASALAPTFFPTRSNTDPEWGMGARCVRGGVMLYKEQGLRMRRGRSLGRALGPASFLVESQGWISILPPYLLPGVSLLSL